MPEKKAKKFGQDIREFFYVKQLELLRMERPSYEVDEEGAFVYKKEDDSGRLIFIHRFWGENPLSGYKHITTLDGLLLWAMNYQESVLVPKNLSYEQIIKFRDESLVMADQKLPIVGKHNFSRKDLLYVVNINGDFVRFRGEDQIIYNRYSPVYNRNFHGGLMIQI